MAVHVLSSPGSRREGTASGCPSIHKSRRDLLGAAGFTALAGFTGAAIARPDAHGAELTAPSADAPLLALCDRFLVLQAAVDASYARQDKQYRALDRRGASYEQLEAVEAVGEAERTPACDEQVALLDKIGELSASTLAGQRARARVLIAWYSLGKDERHHVVLEWSRLAPLFRDVLEEAV